MGSARSYASAEGANMLPGVVRRTLAYNEEVMLCHFELKKGAKIPLHNHRPSQIGFIVSGRIQFIGATDADAFEAKAGDSYVLDPEVQHGGEAMEDSVFIEVFSPSRPEYQDF
jgi:quercetin dioxygenase-like cupin family protein